MLIYGLVVGLMSLCGAAMVLRPDGGGFPWPASGAEWLAMFAGGAIVSLVTVAALTITTALPGPPDAQATWLWGVVGMAFCILGGNLALQYGAARLPAQITAVVMVSEVLFATASAVAFGAGTLNAATALGGLLILSAALLAAWRR